MGLRFTYLHTAAEDAHHNITGDAQHKTICIVKKMPRLVKLEKQKWTPAGQYVYGQTCASCLMECWWTFIAAYQLAKFNQEWFSWAFFSQCDSSAIRTFVYGV